MSSLRQDRANDLWAITTYFNPCGYRSRYENYQTFRKHLKVPLLTVELAYGDTFELNARDATKLIQLRSDQVMWQKERLLNIAMQALPPECRKVAWLDCDILFERDDWPGTTSQVLEEYTLVQLFSRVCLVGHHVDLSQPLAAQRYVDRKSMAAGIVSGLVDFNQLDGSSSVRRAHGLPHDYSPGHAWAMRRKDLEQVSLYDAMILGGGDYAMLQAAMGRSEAYVQERQHNPSRAQHYLGWAKQFHGMVDGNIGMVPGDIYSLWHGELQDRNYVARRSILHRFNFDPYHDIAVDENDCWRWNSDKPGFHDEVKAYFQGRKEDGR